VASSTLRAVISLVACVNALQKLLFLLLFLLLDARLVIVDRSDAVAAAKFAIASVTW
jgi:hypothetical protein